jgi:hypothetical protein
MSEVQSCFLDLPRCHSYRSFERICSWYGPGVVPKDIITEVNPWQASKPFQMFVDIVLGPGCIDLRYT